MAIAAACGLCRVEHAYVMNETKRRTLRILLNELNCGQECIELNRARGRCCRLTGFYDACDIGQLRQKPLAKLPFGPSCPNHEDCQEKSDHKSRKTAIRPRFMLSGRQERCLTASLQ
ncbi:hypothetical protein ACOJBM_04005 [Rhizobium beringeri]